MREREWVFVSVYSIRFVSIELCVFSRVCACVCVCVLSSCVFKYAIICEPRKIESLSHSLTKYRARREEDRSDELWDAIVTVV
jgi:hypothetical protein